MNTISGCEYILTQQNPQKIKGRESQPVYGSHRSASLTSPPKATTVLTEENTSSATAPAAAYSLCSALANDAINYRGNKIKCMCNNNYRSLWVNCIVLITRYVTI